MPVPIIAAGAAAVAARLAAKKLAQEAAKKAAKATAAKTAQIAKNSVKVIPRKTAPKTDLSNRGAQLTRAQRSERAQDYQFDKSLGKYYSNQDRIAGTSPSELARGSRGEGIKSARKTAAVKKEAKSVVKINSASKQTADSARAAALRAAKNKALANSAKGKTQTPTAEAARRRNLNK